MRYKIVVSVLVLLFCTSLVSSQSKISKVSTDKSVNQKNEHTIYQFVVYDINQKPFDFSKLKGKKIMIVNTASKCGYTPQYEHLQKLYEKYHKKGLVIVGFPANNFKNQEPGTNEEIATFCQVNYGVTFPMMEKISVKGDDMHRIYEFLTQKSKNGVMDSEVAWNFQKYLINEKGMLEKMVKHSTSPLDPEIIKWIEN